jgi:hypothetical protein
LQGRRTREGRSRLCGYDHQSQSSRHRGSKHDHTALHHARDGPRGVWRASGSALSRPEWRRPNEFCFDLALLQIQYRVVSVFSTVGGPDRYAQGALFVEESAILPNAAPSGLYESSSTACLGFSMRRSTGGRLEAINEIVVICHVDKIISLASISKDNRVKSQFKQ